MKMVTFQGTKTLIAFNADNIIAVDPSPNKIGWCVIITAIGVTEVKGAFEAIVEHINEECNGRIPYIHVNPKMPLKKE